VGGRKLRQVLGHQGNIGGLQCHLGDRNHHRDADIGAGKGGGIVHPVADEGGPATRPGLIDKTHLVTGQEARVDFIRPQAKPGTDAAGDPGPVAGHHQDRGPLRAEGGKGIGSGLAGFVYDGNPAKNPLAAPDKDQRFGPVGKGGDDHQKVDVEPPVMPEFGQRRAGGGDASGKEGQAKRGPDKALGKRLKKGVQRRDGKAEPAKKG
jgi:hypothetical protein